MDLEYASGPTAASVPSRSMVDAYHRDMEADPVAGFAVAHRGVQHPQSVNARAGFAAAS